MTHIETLLPETHFEEYYSTETLVPPQEYPVRVLTKEECAEVREQEKHWFVPYFVPIIEDYVGLGMKPAEIAVTRNVSLPTISKALTLYFKKPDFSLTLQSKV